MKKALRILLPATLLAIASVALATCSTPAPAAAAPASPARADPAPPPVILADKVDLALVRGGSFTMGDDGGPAPSKPAHQVTLSSFLIGTYEITEAQYRFLMGSLPGEARGETFPVTAVAWEGAARFCNALSAKEGLEPCYSSPDGGSHWIGDFSKDGYRLPTEAEWEFAAKGGTLGKGSKYPGGDNLDAIAWTPWNSDVKAHPVGLLLPNELGIYDMAGNAWEWCDDVYGPYAAAPATDPRVQATSGAHAMRGGSFDLFTPFDCYLPASRIGNEATGGNCGFRVARNAPK